MKAIERLKQYIDYKGFSNSSFEKKNELSNGYIATQLKRNADLGEGILNKILDNCLDVSPEWLLTGKGSMLKKDAEPTIISQGLQNSPLINYNRMPSVITISEKDEEKENIEIVPAKLAAEYVGGGYAEESFVLDLPKFRLPYLNNGTFRCFAVSGHSMNRVQDEDWFVGKFVDNIRNFNEGKIHAVIAPKAESLLIKRVFRHPKKMDTLILRSDSNDESNIYPDIHMPISLIAEMWSYTALISFKEPLFDAVKFKEIAKTAPEFIDVKDYFS